jgi:hypothetical protein
MKEETAKFTIYSILISYGVSIIFMFLRRERFFYWWASMLMGILLTPTSINFFEGKHNKLYQDLTSYSYQCPRATGGGDTISFGSTYDSGAVATTKVEVDEVDEEEDEEIVRPCIDRYRGEPLLSYVQRRTKIMWLEYRNRKSNTGDWWQAMKHRLQHYDVWSYLPAGEEVAPIVYVFHQGMDIKKPLHDLLVNTQIYRSNLQKSQVKVVQLNDSCRNSKRKIENKLTTLLDRKIAACKKLNHREIVHFCNEYHKSGKRDKKFDYERCIAQEEYEYALELAKGEKPKTLCNQYTLKRNLKAICIGDEDSNMDVLINDFKLEVPVVAVKDTELGNIKSFARAIVGYRDDIVLGKTVKKMKTETILDELDGLVTEGQQYFYFHLKNILKRSRALQMREVLPLSILDGEKK